MTCLDPWPLGKWASEVTHPVRKSTYPRQPDGTFFQWQKQTNKKGCSMIIWPIMRWSCSLLQAKKRNIIPSLLSTKKRLLPTREVDWIFFFVIKDALQRVIVTYCIELSVSRQFTCNILNHISHLKLSSSDIRVPLMWTQDDHNKTKTGTLSLNGHFLIHNLVNAWW